MRSRFLDHAVALACGVTCLSACRSGSGTDLTRARDRNILLITVDTLRADALGCDGGPARTPNIDALARAGIRFTFAHAHAPVTLPSHASILTGLYPFQHGIRENSGFRLAPNTGTLATRLKAAGFATGAFIGAFPLDARFGLTPGFDVYDGRFDDRSAGADFVIPERRATVVVTRARAWIAAQRKGWFAWVHVFDPHAPYDPPDPFDREYADQPYYGEVAAVDAALGPLLDDMRAQARPTLVVLTGDHGEALGAHGELTHGLFAYEPTLRIPFIVGELGAAAGKRHGVVSPAPARHVDIAPTILDTLSMPVPPELPGRSLRTAVARDSRQPLASYFEAMSGTIEYGWAPLSGVLFGREKYIDLPMPELYDLEADTSEARNLLPRDAERGRTLAARLTAFQAPRPRAPGAEPADVAARLRSLGYVSGGVSPKTRYTEQDDPKRLIDLERLMRVAVTRGEDGRLREAAELYRQVLARRPDMTAASRHLAFAYWRLGEAASAIRTLRATVEANGPSGDTGVQLGAYLLGTGHATEAVTQIERATKAEPSFDAWTALGLAYGQAGRSSDALAAFDRSLAIDPNSAVVYENIGAIHLDANRPADAERAFARAVALNPESAQGHAGLAMVASTRGDRRAAIAHWKRAVEIDPRNFDALHDLGMMLLQEGERTEARTYLDRFVRTAPPAQYEKEIQQATKVLTTLRP